MLMMMILKSLKLLIILILISLMPIGARQLVVRHMQDNLNGLQPIGSLGYSASPQRAFFPGSVVDLDLDAYGSECRAIVFT